MTEKQTPTTTPDWQAAVRRRTRFYLLVAVLLVVLFGVLVCYFPNISEKLLTSKLDLVTLPLHL